MVLTRWILPALLLWPAVAAAQSEAALKNYFEGRSVTLKLAMPGTESGVDIYPADPKPLATAMCMIGISVLSSRSRAKPSRRFR